MAWMMAHIRVRYKAYPLPNLYSKYKKMVAQLEEYKATKDNSLLDKKICSIIYASINLAYLHARYGF